MFKSALVPVAIAAVALAQFQDRPRPAPALNADPTDTNNPRLVGKTWPYADLPYKVDTLETERGIQVGFNQCNASTQNPTSMCQTLIANSIEDFCLFIPPTLMEVGNAEAGMVAACTKPTHGTRLIPAGAITGIRFMTTPSYVMMAGRINANLMNIPTGDGGGEVDSGGQDQRGNPIGAMVYSTALPFHKGTMSHGRVWHQFIGDDTFCFKACDPSAPDAMGLCEHVYDTVGCQINVPQDYAALQGVFEQCEGDDQKPVQPGVSDIPASSNCRTYASSAIFSGLPTASGSTPTPTGGASSTGSVSGSGTPRPSGTTSRSPTGSQTAGAGDGDDGALSVSWNALTLLVPVVAGLLGAAYVA